MVTAPTDSFASIVADMSASPFDPVMLPSWIHRIERLDAEMRKDAQTDHDFIAGQVAEIDALECDLSQLRARLAACENDAERYRWIRQRLQIRKEESAAGNKRDAFCFRIGHSFVDSKGIPGAGYLNFLRFEQECEKIDAAIDVARASVPKDAAT